MPIGLAVSGRKQVDPKGDLWNALIKATSQSQKAITPVLPVIAV